jgi:hypothetical protein
MSKASLVINLRMENSGDLPLEITAIHLENNFDLNYMNMSNGEVFLSGKKISLPLTLKSGEFVLLQAKYEISAGKDANDLFAADFRALPRSILHEISFETRDVHGVGQKTYVSKIETPSRPLIDLYVKQWREYAQEEYLMLAGHK